MVLCARVLLLAAVMRTDRQRGLKFHTDSVVLLWLQHQTENFLAKRVESLVRSRLDLSLRRRSYVECALLSLRLCDIANACCTGTRFCLCTLSVPLHSHAGTPDGVLEHICKHNFLPHCSSIVLSNGSDTVRQVLMLLRPPSLHI